MKPKFRYVAYSLVTISIVLTLLVAYPEVNRSRAKARLLAPTVGLDPRTVGVGYLDEPPATTTFTPAPEGLRTWSTLSRWKNDRWNCGEIGINALTGIGDYFSGPAGPDPPIGQVGVGYIDHWDAGGGPLPCQEQFKAEYRGTIWFDLSEIFNKSPLPFADNATLKFKRMVTAANDNNGNKVIDKVCKDHVAAANLSWWREGRDSKTFIPEGDLIPPSLNDCPYEGCSINVTNLVNNWMTGKEARYGFVIVGEDTKYVYGLYPRDNAACETYYGDFSLTVTYRFATRKITTPPQTYPLVCRGIETLKVADVDGPVGFRWIGFTFIPGTKPAGEGLLPGQCSWVNRGMRAGEPHRVAEPIEGAAAWTRDLDSSDSYWTFDVYNAGGQLQATRSKRNKFVIPLRTNYALASSGATASASTTMTGSFSPGAAIDGDRKGLNALKGGIWVGAGPTNNDWLQVDFGDSKTINEIDVFMVQNDYLSPIEPTADTKFDLIKGYGLIDFAVQYRTRFGDWLDVPGGKVTGNDKVWRQFTFPELRTRQIRVLVSKTPDGYSRLTELEAWGK